MAHSTAVSNSAWKQVFSVFLQCYFNGEGTFIQAQYSLMERGYKDSHIPTAHILESLKKPKAELV